ncbi:MAG TPA: EAL domain-containing protein [Gammaproteobacteria bacterium]|nr:EAL domain-containing protein [Gammaproteobacteria bacterium]HIK69134.1 EAL domain-containing protein [Pseudomonadales bacterium]
MMAESTIFIVEDEVIVARDIQSRLQKMGYEVTGTAARGEDAVERVLDQRPDLVLMDINLRGEMDGIDAAANIRAEYDVPIIFCTAYSNKETLARAKITAPYGYVLKPFDNRELDITIEMALYEHQMDVKLEVARERLLATVSNIDDGIVTADRQGRMLLVNAAATRMLGLDQDNLIGAELASTFELSEFASGDPFFSLSTPEEATQLVNQPVTRQYLTNADGEKVPIEIGSSWFELGQEQLLVITFRDIRERLSQEEQLVRSAFYDALTLLPNRQLFLDRLTSRMILPEAIATEASGRSRFAIVIFGIDRLSVINQGLGIEAGDKVIIEVGQRIRTALTAQDTISHFGGGTFAVLLFNVGDAGQAVVMVNDIQAEIEKNLSLASESSVSVVASAGIVVNSEQYTFAEEMIRDGETALQRAKQEPANSYVVFNSAMYEEAKRFVYIRSALQEAILENELVCFYQPIVELKTLEISSFEALVRWNHKELGNVSPTDFIPVAEQSDLILPLGDQLLEQVCRQLSAFKREGLKEFSIAVNISSQQFNVELPQRLDNLISETGLSPSDISLEITEGVAMAAIESNFQLMEAFHNRGHRISVDDFGTGYSSLAYLKRFPLDTLKIDQAFIRELALDSDDFVITKAIIDLGRSLGLKIIAEGIETASQLEILRQLGCNLGQGYYFQKACSAQHILDAYQARQPLGKAILPQ